MLRPPAASDGGDELVVPRKGVETAVLAKLQLGTSELYRLLRFVKVFMLLLFVPDLQARQPTFLLLQKFQQNISALTVQQLRTAFNVIWRIRGNFKLLSFAKSERRMMSQLLAPRVVELEIAPSQLRASGFVSRPGRLHCGFALQRHKRARLGLADC
mmetsp:Transcript_20450/g.44451  ORF Transcript_20450/g.44451 Transcript_20450/m.44451 type:complete len:157 (+) Transcript_20450:550-1020(+)